MADYIARFKNVIANVKSKDLVLPANPILIDIGKAFVSAYRGRWESFIASAANDVSSNTPPVSTIVNPADTSDPSVIGEWNGDTDTFTPLSANDRNRLMGKHFLRELRRHIRDVFVKYRNDTTTLQAGDAGETIDEAKAGIDAAAKTEANTEIGDDDNDPEL